MAANTEVTVKTAIHNDGFHQKTRLAKAPNVAYDG